MSASDALAAYVFPAATDRATATAVMQNCATLLAAAETDALHLAALVATPSYIISGVTITNAAEVKLIVQALTLEAANSKTIYLAFISKLMVYLQSISKSVPASAV